MLRDTDRPYPASGYMVEVIDGEAVLFHPTKLTIMHLNSTAALIWRLCDRHRHVSDICDILCAAYPESSPQIQTDVTQVLSLFKELGALEIGGEATDVTGDEG